MDYKTYLVFFSDFYVSAFEILKSKDSQINQFDSLKDRRGKYIIMQVKLPQYGIHVPRQEFLTDLCTLNAPTILSEFNADITFKEIILNDFRLRCNLSPVFRNTLSSFRDNWDTIRNVAKNPLLSEHLRLLLRTPPEQIKNIQHDALLIIQKSDPLFIFQNAIKYAFLLNYALEEKTRVSTDTIVIFFSKQFDSDQETVIFCYTIIFPIAIDPRMYFTLLFHYACTL